LRVNEGQTLRDEYSCVTKILETDYKPASLDEVIRSWDNIHVEEQNTLKILLKIHEHLFDGPLGDFNMRKIAISLQMMDPNFKPVYECLYNVTRSSELKISIGKGNCKVSEHWSP
jgi:hypothetical protein